MPVLDITRPENWNRLLAVEDLDPLVREKILQMQFLAAQGEWHPKPPGKRWSDPY